MRRIVHSGTRHVISHPVVNFDISDKSLGKNDHFGCLRTFHWQIRVQKYGTPLTSYSIIYLKVSGLAQERSGLRPKVWSSGNPYNGKRDVFLMKKKREKNFQHSDH